MSNIDIKNFVDINIIRKDQITIDSTRETTLLLCDNVDTLDKEITNIEDAKTLLSGDAIALKYAKTYFNNGGISLKILKYDSTSAKNNEENIRGLDKKYIVIAYAKKNNLTDIKSLATLFKEDKNVDQKIFLANEPVNETYTDLKEYPNIAIKLTPTEDADNKYCGCEMTIASYLSQINVYKSSSIKDYMFTIEQEDEDSKLELNISNSQYLKAITNNRNLDIMLASKIRNCGGNLTNGVDLVNQFCLIVLNQTLMESALNVLISKIKGQTGLSELYVALAEELNKYARSGYLVTDKIWTKKDLIVKDSKGNSHTIISQNTALLNGYKIVILPYSSLSDKEVKEHKTPYIYVVLAEGYGIRVITINGEVM